MDKTMASFRPHVEFHTLHVEFHTLHVEFHTLQVEFHTLQVEFHTLQVEFHALQVEFHALYVQFTALASECESEVETIRVTMTPATYRLNGPRLCSILHDAGQRDFFM